MDRLNVQDPKGFIGLDSCKKGKQGEGVEGVKGF